MKFDTEANVHATSSCKLISYTLSINLFPRDANGKSGPATMTGTIAILDNHGKILKLENVLIIPTLRKYIISGSELVTKSYNVTLSKKCV